MSKVIIGDRIRSRREELKLSQNALAELIGYADKSAISKIENGINELNQSKIAMFADALQTTTSYLMGWTDSAAKPIPENKGKHIQASTPDIQQAYSDADEETKKAVRNLLGL